MKNKQPLVSIGIPTYNRSELLKRAVDSVLSQDYKNIEIIISDNASTDNTEAVSLLYSENDSRLHYHKNIENLGSSKNFSIALEQASGHFFMWLGDDDWLDSTYISCCVKALLEDESMSLVYGAPCYYQKGEKAYEGKTFSLLSDLWWRRVIQYYKQVTDNGMFYGVMRTEQIRTVRILNTMGGDWLMIANIVSLGKVMVIPSVSVHRELGGATVSYEEIAKSLGLSKFQVLFPMLSIATNACVDIVVSGCAFKTRSIILRCATGGFVFFNILICRQGTGYLNRIIGLFKAALSKLYRRL